MSTGFRALLAALPLVFAASLARAADPGPCSAWRDDGSDGRVDTRTEYLYTGRRLATELVLPARGGRPLSVTEYVYDRNGRLWGKATDLNDDGQSDRNVYLTYDARGRLSGEAVDERADGSFNRFVHYSYQGSARIAHHDLDANGSIDRRDVVSYAYLEGNLSSESLDEGSDRYLDQVTSYIYDASDNRVYELVDEDANGTTDVVIGYLYDCW